MIGHGKSALNLCKKTGVSEKTCYRWRLFHLKLDLQLSIEIDFLSAPECFTRCILRFSATKTESSPLDRVRGFEIAARGCATRDGKASLFRRIAELFYGLVELRFGEAIGGRATATHNVILPDPARRTIQNEDIVLIGFDSEKPCLEAIMPYDPQTRCVKLWSAQAKHYESKSRRV